MDNDVVLHLRIVIWMLQTELSTLSDFAGVLNTPALAGVVGGPESFLIFIRRILPKSHDQAYKGSG
jgi:hypothetical protein